MDGVEASRIIRVTLEAISKQHGIEIETLREAHRPILKALYQEAGEKLRTAEVKGYDNGRQHSQITRELIYFLGFGRIGKGEDIMDKFGVYSLIESIILRGGKFPEAVGLKRIQAVQSELESCTSIHNVLTILSAHRELICMSFGISDSDFDECLENIQSLESADSKGPKELREKGMDDEVYATYQSILSEEYGRPYESN